MNYLHLECYHERQNNDRRMLSRDKQHFLRAEKQTICKMEIDVTPENIVVMRSDSGFTNPGLVLVWDEEKRRLIESGKDLKGIFKSNLKDCGRRSYSKKRLELNYQQQLNDYLNYKDNYNLFHQHFNDRIDRSLRSVQRIQEKSFVENLNQSLSQTVIERIIESEKELFDTNQLRQVSQLDQRQPKLLNRRDIQSQEFLHLIKNLKSFDKSCKASGLQQVLNDIQEEKNESDSEDGLSDDELDLEKEAKFTQLMLKTTNSILNNQSKDDSALFTIDENHLSREAFRLEDTAKDASQDTLKINLNETKDRLSQHSSQPTHSDSSSQTLDPNNFNLNNESLIGTPTGCDKSKELSLDSNDSRLLKRPCAFDDQYEVGHLVSLNDEPLFEDDDEEDTFTNVSSQQSFLELSQSTCNKVSQKSEMESVSQQKPLSQSSDGHSQQGDSQTENKSIFSFYSLESVCSQNDFTPLSLSQPKTPAGITPIDDQAENANNNRLNVEQPQTSTSTPVNCTSKKSQTDKYRIRASLGSKFMKLSKGERRSPRPQSPLLLPTIQIQSPNDSLNKSNQSTQSKHHESSFTMNEKIQHLSESSIDYESPMTRLSHENQNLTLLTMELFATTDHELKPNPLNDSIKMIFYMIYNDYTDELMQHDRSKTRKHFTGIIIQEANIDMFNIDLDQSTSQDQSSTSMSAFNLTTHTKRKPKAASNFLYFQNSGDVKVDYVSNELCLIEKFIEILVEHDPDIITGYEIETSSWGYLISRAELLRIDISIAFSRLLMDFGQTRPPPTQSTGNGAEPKLKQTILNRTRCEEEDDQFEFELSDQEDLVGGADEDDKDANPILNNNYLNRNKWESLEKFKQNRTDFGTIKTREDLRNKVKENDDIVRQYQTIFSLSWVSPCYMSLVGRIMLNLWRCIRKSELALNSYSFENVYYQLFKRRRPYYSYKQLTEWYYSNNNFLKQNVLNYFLTRVQGNIEIIERLGIVNTTSELARVFGIQFSDVISKGSQFRVESLLYRSTIEDSQFEVHESNVNSNSTTPDLMKFKSKTNFNKSIQSDMNLSRTINKSLNRSADMSQKQGSQTKRQKFMLLSCNFEDRLVQQNPVIIPFVMEPKSGFYTNNVAVLDFQSLYPSIMIAYNYCYSTCLGKLDYITNNLKEFPLGFSSLRVSTDFLKEHADNINISPNGILFVNPTVRKGILSSILEEIIDTRLMVKKCLKMYNAENEQRIAKLLDARQTGLKLLANVTYGYTAAGFSGRMPCIDIADSIISKARETLINSINFINKSVEFGGEVIYGDTDSMFIEFKNTTREEAFRRAEKLCELITLANPNPIKLKLEKVYSECVLLSKKHYAGYAYDSPEQKAPRFETKG